VDQAIEWLARYVQQGRPAAKAHVFTWPGGMLPQRYAESATYFDPGAFPDHKSIIARAAAELGGLY
jgi:hypothetical protein